MRRRTNEVAREARMCTTPHPTTSWNAQPCQLTCVPLSRGCRESGGVPMHYDTMHATPSFKKNVFNVFNYNYNIIIADTRFIQWGLQYGMYPHLLWEWCLQVRVRCGKSWPAVYACWTLLGSDFHSNSQNKLNCSPWLGIGNNFSLYPLHLPFPSIPWIGDDQIGTLLSISLLYQEE